MIPFLDLKAQYAALREEVEEAVQRVLASGWYILGPEVEAFESEFAAYIGAPYAVGVGSGTEALHLALWACDVGPGDEVITVSHTAVATVAAVCLRGARPVFVDIDPVTYTMDVAQVAERLTPRTKALLPVHLYGQAAEMAPLVDLARRSGLRVIEDAAQAHGATYRGRKVGTWGDIACFSFYPTKNLGAYGDGGMVVTGDRQLAERVRLLREYAWRERYVSESLGTNSRLDELHAAVLRVKLRHLDEWNAARRERAALYARLLGESPLRLPREGPERTHVYHLYVVAHEKRNGLRAHLQGQGVGTAVHYPVPVHLQPGYREYGAGPGSLPASEKAAREVLSLPLYPELPLEAVERVAEAVLAYPEW